MAETSRPLSKACSHLWVRPSTKKLLFRVVRPTQFLHHPPLFFFLVGVFEIRCFRITQHSKNFISLLFEFEMSLWLFDFLALRKRALRFRMSLTILFVIHGTFLLYMIQPFLWNTLCHYFQEFTLPVEGREVDVIVNIEESIPVDFTQ